MARIAIVHPDDPNRPKIIPSELYRDDMELWDEEAAPAPTDTSLPEDFPARAQLIEDGLDTLSKVRAVRDWDEVEGIGQVREARIAAYLEDFEG